MVHPPARAVRAVRALVVATLAVLLAQTLLPGGATTTASATAGTAAAAAPTVAEPLLPNLIALKARDLYVVRRGGDRWLRFESALGNVGAGPVEIRPNENQPCPAGRHHASQVMYRDVNHNGRYNPYYDTELARRPAGCMVFHPYHDHWHFEAASRYALFRAERPERVQVVRRKMSFCLRDSRRVPESYGTFPYAERYGKCSRYSPQGISIGWVDVYQSFLAGQALKLPEGTRDGLYCLKVSVDPQDQILEIDDDDNQSTRAFYLRGTQVNHRHPRTCSGLG